MRLIRIKIQLHRPAEFTQAGKNLKAQSKIIRDLVRLIIGNAFPITSIKMGERILSRLKETEYCNQFFKDGP
jgi:hypothetical protein